MPAEIPSNHSPRQCLRAGQGASVSFEHWLKCRKGLRAERCIRQFWKPKASQRRGAVDGGSERKQRSTPTVIPGAALPWPRRGRVGGYLGSINWGLPFMRCTTIACNIMQWIPAIHLLHGDSHMFRCLWSWPSPNFSRCHQRPNNMGTGRASDCQPSPPPSP